MNEKIIKDGKEIASKGVGSGKGVLHNIFIIDASNSMNDSSYVDGRRTTKYMVANQGINDEITELKKDDKGDVNISLIEFDSAAQGTERITEHYINTPLKNVKEIAFRGARGNTPLYQTIAYTINKFLRLASNEDTVLIKIFTDGAHNCFWGITERECKALIKDVQDRREFIITFIGTERDTEHAINSLGMERGNTMSYNGTAGGASASMDMMRGSTYSLVADRRSGKELKSKSFYKQDENKDANTKV